MSDPTGNWPKWAKTVAKVALGVAIVSAGVALTSITFGASAPLTVVITAAVVGTVGGAATNAAIQYSKKKSWDDFNVDECIAAGVTGGLSATLAATPIGRAGQAIGNAVLAGGNSLFNGNSAIDIAKDSVVGFAAGLAGGPGTGRGGLYMNEAHRVKDLLTAFGKGYVKSSVVSNIRSIADWLGEGAQNLVSLYQ